MGPTRWPAVRVPECRQPAKPTWAETGLRESSNLGKTESSFASPWESWEPDNSVHVREVWLVSICLEFGRWLPQLSERPSLVASCLWRRRVEEIDRAHEHRSDADFTARHGRVFESVEESLCLEEPPGGLENNH